MVPSAFAAGNSAHGLPKAAVPVVGPGVGEGSVPPPPSPPSVQLAYVTSTCEIYIALPDMTYNDVYVSESVVKSNTNSLLPVDVIVITAPVVDVDTVVRNTL